MQESQADGSSLETFPLYVYVHVFSVTLPRDYIQLSKRKTMDTIQKGDLWERLNRIWEEERKPGWVIWKGIQYQVLTPDDETVVFVKRGAMDDLYASSSSIQGAS